MGSNKFAIPEDALALIRERDKDCVYCGKVMVFPYDRQRSADSATIEHLDRDGPLDWPELRFEDIAICCSACNASRGKKLHEEWFVSPYCLERGITFDAVAEPVRVWLVAYLTRR